MCCSCKCKRREMTEAERKLFMKFVWINVVLFSIMFIIIPLIFGIIPYYLGY